MSSTASERVPIPSLEIQLSGFIHLLHQRGFVVTPAHYLECNTLLGYVPLQPESLSELADYLCPVFAENEKQQERFHEIYQQYFSTYLGAEVPRDGGMRSSSPRPVRPEAASVAKFIQTPNEPDSSIKVSVLDKLLSYLSYVFGFLLFALLFYFFYHYSLSTYAESPGGFLGGLIVFGLTSLSILLLFSLFLAITNFYPRRNKLASVVVLILFFAVRIYFPDFIAKNTWDYWGNLGVLGIAYLAIASVGLMFNGSIRPPKKEEPKKAPPYNYQPIIDLQQMEIIDTREGHEASLIIAQSTDRSEFINNIDLPSTLQRTISNAGFMQTVLEKRRLESRYLLLIDQASGNSHQQQWYDYFFQMLKHNDVPVERYFFNTDPKRCWQEVGEYTELADLFNQQRLILYGSGEGFVDQITGKIFPWVQDVFGPWAHQNKAALLSPKVLLDWDFNEKSLQELFILAPASLKGLKEVIQSFDQQDQRLRAYWLEEERNRQFPKGDPEALFSSLPESVFHWVCACALYPRVYWDLTLFIGKSLESFKGEILNKENLDLITAISWFQGQPMTSEDRMALIRRLPYSKALIVRRALLGLLRRPENVLNIPPKNSYAYEEYRQQLLRNKAVASSSTISQINSLETLRKYHRNAVNPDEEIGHYLEQHPNWTKRVQFGLQQGALQLGQQIYKIGRTRSYQFRKGELENLIQIRPPSSKIFPELGVYFLKTGRNREIWMANATLETLPEQEQQNINKDTQTYSIDRTGQTGWIDRKQTNAILREIAQDSPSVEFQDYLSHFDLYSFVFLDLRIEALDLDRVNRRFFKDPIPEEPLVDLSNIQSSLKNLFGLLQLPDLVNEQHHFALVDQVIYCSRWRIYGEFREKRFSDKPEYIELDFGPDGRKLGFTTRRIDVTDPYFQVGEPLEGSLSWFQASELKSKAFTPQARPTATFNFFNNTFNPGYPSPLPDEADGYILIPDQRPDAAAVVTWKEGFSLPFDLSLEYQIFSELSSNTSNQGVGDGIVIMIGKDLDAYAGTEPPRGHRRGFIEDGSGYGLHLNVFPEQSVQWKDGNGETMKDVPAEFMSASSIWGRLEVQVRLNGIRVLINDREVLYWEGQLNLDNLGIAVGAATGAASGQHMVRQLTCVPVEEQVFARVAEAEEVEEIAVAEEMEEIAVAEEDSSIQDDEEFRVGIEELIGQGELQAALEEGLAYSRLYLDRQMQDTWMLLLSRLNEVEERERSGRIAWAEAMQQRNIIIRDTLKLLSLMNTPERFDFVVPNRWPKILSNLGQFVSRLFTRTRRPKFGHKITTKIKELISEAEIQRALQVGLDHAREIGSESQNEWSNLIVQLRNLTENEIKGITRPEDSKLERNKIILEILSLLDQVTEEPVTDRGSSARKSGRDNEEVRERIQELITNTQMEEALQVGLNYARESDPKTQNNWIRLSAQFKQLMNREITGSISEEQRNVEFNAIVRKTLILLDEMTEHRFSRRSRQIRRSKGENRQIRERIQELVTKAQTREALQVGLKYAREIDPKTQNDWIRLSAQFQQLMDREGKGLIDNETYIRTSTVINREILNLLKAL